MVAISPRAFQLLELLLRSRPRALSKAEIHSSLWPDTFVSESSLARLVCEARRAIADDARKPALLRTAYRFGYAFAGAASAEPETGVLAGSSGCRLVWGNQELPLREGENVLGRTEDAVVRVDSTKVSRRHARILVSRGRAILEDLGSKNGTYLHGRRIESPSELTDGDEICVGPVLLVFRTLRGAVSTETDVR